MIIMTSLRCYIYILVPKLWPAIWQFSTGTLSWTYNVHDKDIIISELEHHFSQKIFDRPCCWFTCKWRMRWASMTPISRILATAWV